jgi:Cu2+-exporting ATPase
MRLGSRSFCGLDDQVAMDAASDREASFIYFACGGRGAAIPIRQALRPDAAAVTAALRARGLDLLVLSGDRPEAVAPVARRLGLTQWLAGLTPAAKIAVIEQLKAQGCRVLMVGDGLNDAPALAAAHASLSPISAAHLTQTQADALFLGDRLMPVLRAVVLSRRARVLMRENLTLAVIYNAIAVPIAIAGFVTPLIAAVAMSGSSILVTLNALRARLGARLPDTEVADAGVSSADSRGEGWRPELGARASSPAMAPGEIAPAIAQAETIARDMEPVR